MGGERRAILVLGMHRSGTSALTRALHAAGAAAPATLMPAGPDNPGGFWESAPVSAYNEEILAAAGFSWRDWRAFPFGAVDAAARAELDRRMTAVLRDEFGAAGLFVLKDPRLSRLLPLWLPALAALGIGATAVIAIRHPGAVARSLARRNGISARTAGLLWLRYVLDAELFTRALPRVFVSFDGLLRDPAGVVARVGAALGVAWPRQPDLGFVEARVAEPEHGPVLDSAYGDVWCRHAWQGLRALEQAPAAESAVLDRVRGQFEDACRLFAPALATPRTTTRAGGLSGVTLCAADSLCVPLTERALMLSAARGDFADAMLFSDLPAGAGVSGRTIGRLTSKDDYSAFLLRGLLAHVRTAHVLVVQWDGYVTDPGAWDPGFLAFDYIGARWAWHSPGADVGNGGFSLRSRKLLEALQDPRFAPRAAVAEDELICREWRGALERDFGIVFAPAAVADRFAYENAAPATPTFGFHGVFNLWRHCDDAALVEIAGLLPAQVMRRRDFAKLVARCRRHGRTAAVDALMQAWETVAPRAEIEAALRR
jgi:hypothetical protein